MGCCFSIKEKEKEKEDVVVSVKTIRHKIRVNCSTVDQFPVHRRKNKLPMMKREEECIIAEIIKAVDNEDDDLLVDCLDMAAVYMISVSDIYGLDNNKIDMFKQQCIRAITPARIHKLEFSDISRVGMLYLMSRSNT